ncbi:MAG: hypothetical protein CMP77_05060 [Flavobacterium sp.]|nr:hypothetical protein [Flavobacterium sp.]|tara:strand:- start:24071 stop:24448 length:378 start_codon:yes stop_codon:yes gene_type:complete
MYNNNSQREIERKYKYLLHKVSNDEFYKIDLSNRINCYTCKQCKHITKTKDVDAGVTPMFHTCEKCSHTAISSMYKDIAPEKNPTQEWYRPSLLECFKLKKNQHLLEHVLSGGLLNRIIQTKPQN